MSNDYLNKYVEASLNQPNYIDRIVDIYGSIPEFTYSASDVYNIYNDFSVERVSDPYAALSNLIERCDKLGLKSPFTRETFGLSIIRNDARERGSLIAAFLHSPLTFERLMGEVNDLTIDVFEDRVSSKAKARSLGSVARRYIESKATAVYTDPEQFMTARDKGLILLGGNDQNRTSFAIERLDFQSVSKKGLDFVGRIGGRFTLGEIKLITDKGGGQDNQIEVAANHLCATTSVKCKAKKIAILDGVPFLSENNIVGIYNKHNIADDSLIMSILTFPLFLKDLARGKV